MSVFNSIDSVEHNVCLSLYYLVLNSDTNCISDNPCVELIDAFSNKELRIFSDIPAVVKIHIYCENIVLEESYKNTDNIYHDHEFNENWSIINEFNSARLKSIMYFRFLVYYDIITRKFKLRNHIVCKNDIKYFFLDPGFCVAKCDPGLKIHSDYIQIPGMSFNAPLLANILYNIPPEIFQGRVYVQPVPKPLVCVNNNYCEYTPLENILRWNREVSTDHIMSEYTQTDKEYKKFKKMQIQNQIEELTRKLKEYE